MPYEERRGNGRLPLGWRFSCRFPLGEAGEEFRFRLRHAGGSAGIAPGFGDTFQLLDGEILFQRPGQSRQLPQDFPRRGVPRVAAPDLAAAVFRQFRNPAGTMEVQIQVEVFAVKIVDPPGMLCRDVIEAPYVCRSPTRFGPPPDRCHWSAAAVIWSARSKACSTASPLCG